MPRPGEILAALDLLQNVDANTLTALATDPATVALIKKGKFPAAQDLTAGETVHDLFSDWHREPSAHELAVGVPVEATGANTRHMSALYDSAPNEQADETSRLGRLLEMLEGGLRLAQKELEKAKAKRVRMQQNYPASATGANGDEPREDEEPEDDEEDEAAKAANAVALALRGDVPLRGDLHSLMSILCAPMAAKSAIVAKANAAIESMMLTPEEGMLASDILMKAAAVRDGALDKVQFAKRLAAMPNSVVQAIMAAMRA